MDSCLVGEQSQFQLPIVRSSPGGVAAGRNGWSGVVLEG